MGEVKSKVNGSDEKNNCWMCGDMRTPPKKSSLGSRRAS